MPDDFYVQVTNPNGTTAKVRPVEFRPLTLDDLCVSLGEVQPSLQMAFRGVLDGTAGSNGAIGTNVECTMSVTLDRSPRPFALVQGGWLPFSFVLPRRYFVDRNVVSKLKGLTCTTQRESDASFVWWMEPLRSDQLVLNPLPFAWEGAKRRLPSFLEFERGLEEGREEILKVLPNATVIVFDHANAKVAFDQLGKFARREERQALFLIEIATQLCDPVAKKDLDRIKTDVFTTAQKHQVGRSSFVVFAALSVLYESNEQKSIGRGLLKPAAAYTHADAYNAISDIRNLELAAMTNAALPNSKFALATDDIFLAKLWCALGLRATNPIPGGWNFDFSLDSALFARLSDEQLLSLSRELAEAMH